MCYNKDTEREVLKMITCIFGTAKSCTYYKKGYCTLEDDFGEPCCAECDSEEAENEEDCT